MKYYVHVYKVVEEFVVEIESESDTGALSMGLGLVREGKAEGHPPPAELIGVSFPKPEPPAPVKFIGATLLKREDPK